MALIPTPEPATVEAIYRAYETRNEQWEAEGLSIGVMGGECERALFYAFRWAVPGEKFDGRKLRLFQTGHREEERMVEDLRRAGVTVEDVDPETGRQWKVEALGGHLRGRTDGKATGFVEAPKAVHVLECKTHNDKSFKALQKDKVKKAKPAHYAQMTLYMFLQGIERAFYLAHNKNDDGLYSERVHLDMAYALSLITKAERIISAKRPPARLHEDPNSRMAFQCKWCPAFEQCHGGAFARTNCRTCLHSTPVEGGWHCAKHDKMLTRDEQKAGCPDHLFIPELVPGEQVDADPDAGLVYYVLRNGAPWINGPEFEP